VTTTIEGRERYTVNVRYAREFRDDLDKLRKVLVPTMSGAQIPLQALADIQYARYVNPFMHGHPSTEDVVTPTAYNVIVVGAGNAGMCAALSAVEHGAEKVLVLERGIREERGGNSRFTAGAFRFVIPHILYCS